MQKTREQILEYIRNHQMASAIEISRAFPMTPANARHHLSILEEQNLIEMVGERIPKSRGRPTKLYAITPQVMDHNIDLLVVALLKTLTSNEDLEEKFIKLTPYLFGQSENSDNMINQLNKTVQRMNEMHYKARWEASPEGPRLILGHCPYALIIAENPELCQMDRVMLSQRLGKPVEQIAKMDRDLMKTPHCIFQVR